MTETERDISTDLLVIGGGITGSGIALDAVSRGLKTVLVEKGDFAGGTSSRSSKLVHGGLRYLEQFSFGLMYESISERQRLTRLAPGLVRWAPFLLPHFEGKRKKWKVSAGLRLYDMIAGTESGLRHQNLAPDRVLEHVPGIRQDGLQGGALYHDCVTDDARLVLSVALDAGVRGCSVHNYVIVEELIREKGRAAGAVVRDVLTGETWRVRARQVVAAIGPWTDQTLGLLGEEKKRKRIRPAKGVHILLPRDRLDIRAVLYIPSARDRRSVFVIPWYEGILVGTTDTEYEGPPDEVRPLREDVDYLLDALNWSLPAAGVTVDDILSSFSGIRPLIDAPGKSTADVPREYKIFEPPGGLIVIAGGKLTTYRCMARVVVDRVVRRLRQQADDPAVVPCWTHRIAIGNPPDGDFDPISRVNLPEDIRRHLVADYGVWARQVASILEVYPEWSRRMVPGLPHILAEAHFAATREKARTLEDVLARRTRVALLDPAQGTGCAEEVAEIMAKVLSWNEKEKKRQLSDYREALRSRFCGPGALH